MNRQQVLVERRMRFLKALESRGVRESWPYTVSVIPGGLDLFFAVRQNPALRIHVRVADLTGTPTYYVTPDFSGPMDRVEAQELRELLEDIDQAFEEVRDVA